MLYLVNTLLVAVLATAPQPATDTYPPEAEERLPAMGGNDGILTSSGTAGLALRETTGPDTFVLYGGPDHPTEGKFQLVDGVTPDWGGGNGLPGGYGGGPDAWTPVDLTYIRDKWTVDTFNAENLNGNGLGNLAMWCGLPTGDPDTENWVFTPGYGNNWWEALIYESELIGDPSAGQVVDLDFFFNYDTEAGFDYFSVEYDSAGTWTSVLAVDGSNKDGDGNFAAPGVQFSAVQARPIVYTGGDYGFSERTPPYGSPVVKIRLIFSSDGAWSDQDGLIDTDGGAAQVDDITLAHSEGSFFEDFEGAGPYLFEPDRPPFAGDFADVYPRFFDIDPCRENESPVVGFLDYGQILRNGPGMNDRESTDGSTWPDYAYGIPGNWVFNWSGGISFGDVCVTNEVWSPEIQLDLPGPADDDPAFAGEFIRWSAWIHLPLKHGIFYLWHVRHAMPGEGWQRWTDRNFVYYGGGIPSWLNERQDVSDLIPPGAERMQVALAGWDYCSLFGFGADPGAAPSPIFDNVAVYKYRLPGPTFAARTIDLAQDGFPVNGSVEVSTPASRDALDIPFSMARDVNTGDQHNTPGDSVIVDVASIIGGATLSDVRMVWALNTNPLFEDAIRAAPARAEDENVVAGAAGTVWTGEVLAAVSTTSAGAVVDDRFFVDLPDVDFMYPGDVLHYYFEATDSDGRVSTMPHDIAGFADFDPNTVYDRTFTVRALPNLTDSGGSQPDILVVNDFGRRGNEPAFTTSFRELGYLEGVHYDTYTVHGPTSGRSNGIGSAGAHGATGAQLAGYSHLFYLAGDLSALLLSDGTNLGNNDKGDDLTTLEDWHALEGTRNIAYFGDNIASGLTNDSQRAASYLNTYMCVYFAGDAVHDAIGGQNAPVATPSSFGSTWFTGDFAVYDGCSPFNQVDQIQWIVGAYTGHEFRGPDGVPITDPDMGVASVIYPNSNGYRVTFPFSLNAIRSVTGRTTGPSARTQLLGETLGLFAAVPGGSPVAAPQVGRLELSVSPNPFNPMTTVRFTGVIGKRGSVKIYNLRGELVRTLHGGEFTSSDFTWEGTDARGAAVASGVYLVEAEAGGQKRTTKVALVR